MPIYQDLSSAALLENAGQEQLANSLGTSRALSAGGTLKKVTEMQERGATQRHAMDIGMQQRVLGSQENSAKLDREWQTNMVTLQGKIEADKEKAHQEFFKAIHAGNLEAANRWADQYERLELGDQEIRRSTVASTHTLTLKAIEANRDATEKYERDAKKVYEDAKADRAKAVAATEVTRTIVPDDPEAVKSFVASIPDELEAGRMSSDELKNGFYTKYLEKVGALNPKESQLWNAIVTTGKLPPGTDPTIAAALLSRMEGGIPKLMDQLKEHAEGIVEKPAWGHTAGSLAAKGRKGKISYWDYAQRAVPYMFPPIAALGVAGDLAGGQATIAPAGAVEAANRVLGRKRTMTALQERDAYVAWATGMAKDLLVARHALRNLPLVKNAKARQAAVDVWDETGGAAQTQGASLESAMRNAVFGFTNLHGLYTSDVERLLHMARRLPPPGAGATGQVSGGKTYNQEQAGV